MSSSGSKMKKKHIKAVSQKVKIFRANEPLLSVFMWGINHTINELTHVTVPVMLMPDDFKAFTKTKVDNHLFNKDNMPSHFKVKEYCPIVFRNLRERFSIDDLDYMFSLTKSQPVDSDTFTPGRTGSGARFLLSYDKRFVIKTLISEEVEEVHNILKMYHQYVVESHGKTLLPQFLGMYRLTVEGQETYLMVMRNVFSHRFSVHKKFDLKGSTVARQASDKEKEKDLPTYKDNDFLTEGCKIIIGDDCKERLVEIINNDVEFLAKLYLMDYSLLVGIHDVEKAEQEDRERSELQEDGEGDDADLDSDSQGSGAAVPTPPDSPLNPHMPLSLSNNMSAAIDPKIDIYAIPSLEGTPRREIYFMAIIDILTHYGMKKRTAQAAKTVKHGAGAEISTVKPDQYAKRFLEFMTKIIQ